MKYSKELHDRIEQNLRMFDYPRFDDGDIDALLDEIDRLTAELALTEKKLCNIDRSARAEIARRDEEITRLTQLTNRQNRFAGEAREELIRKDDLIKRLMEAGQRMYESFSDPEERAAIEFEEWRKLVEELEGKCQKT